MDFKKSRRDILDLMAKAPKDARPKFLGALKALEICDRLQAFSECIFDGQPLPMRIVEERTPEDH